MPEQRISDEELADMVERPEAWGAQHVYDLAVDLRTCRSALASTEAKADTLAGIVERLLIGFIPGETYGGKKYWERRNAGEPYLLSHDAEPMTDAEVQFFTEREGRSDGD